MLHPSTLIEGKNESGLQPKGKECNCQFYESAQTFARLLLFVLLFFTVYGCTLSPAGSDYKLLGT